MRAEVTEETVERIPRVLQRFYVDSISLKKVLGFLSKFVLFFLGRPFSAESKILDRTNEQPFCTTLAQ